MGIKDILNKIWPWFQSTADRIQKWELSPEVDEAFEKIWTLVPKALQDIIYKELKEIYEKKGVAVAERLLKQFIDWFNKVIKEQE